MQANKHHVLFTCHLIARTARALVAALACAAIGNAAAADWEVWSETTGGMTGAQQITNALTKLSSGDTIRVNPGTYDFTGIWMMTYTKDSYTITNHLARNCNYSLVGVTDGHWDDAVVFKGDRRCLDSHWANGMGSCNVTIRNITFEDFNAGECPCGGSYESRGGALRLTDSVTTVDIVSNCVVRNCHAYIGGAVNGGVLIDCLVTNNSSSSQGGATCNTCIRDCQVKNNTSGNYGAFYNHTGIYNTLFEDNTCSSVGGAGMHGVAYPITNCVFRNNTSTGGNGGGAIYAKYTKADVGEIIDCRFEGNRAKSQGGAIYQEGGTNVVPSRIRLCRFTDNVSSNGNGGAIYVNNLATTFSFARDCSFVSNRVCGTGAGGAVYRGSYSNCVFTANVCSNSHGGAALLTRSYGGAAMDCAFVGNVCWTNGYGGAVYCSDDACPFTRCAFTNNFAWYDGGALYRGACTNCTFVGNRCVQSRGASIYSDVDILNNPYLFKSTAVNCLFKDNYRRDNTGRYSGQHTEYQGGDVCGTRMENCEVIDGAGSFWHCSIVNSHFHDLTNSLGHCVFGEESWVTNCLVDHCNLVNRGAAFFYRSHYMPDSQSTEYRGRERGAWVNCTFADNTLNDSYGMVRVYENWCDKNYGPHAACDFVNCIFYNNRKKNGTLADISGQTAFDVTYSNCVYGASDGTLVYGTTNGWTNVGGTFVCEDPHFAKGRAAKLECAYYTPRANSPVLGKGDASFYTETDVDLAGKPRLREGKVDLGAYESWVKPCGLFVIVW